MVYFYIYVYIYNILVVLILFFLQIIDLIHLYLKILSRQNKQLLSIKYSVSNPCIASASLGRILNLILGSILNLIFGMVSNQSFKDYSHHLLPKYRYKYWIVNINIEEKGNICIKDRAFYQCFHCKQCFQSIHIFYLTQEGLILNWKNI